MLKPAPVIVAELTVSAAVPVDFNVSACDVAVPTGSDANVRVIALNVNCGVAAAVLVPLSETSVVAPLLELLLSFSCPVSDPVVVGANSISSVIDCPAASVTGIPPPAMLNPAPLIVAALTVTGAVPVEVSVSACVVEEFTVTLPKLSVPALTVSCGTGAAAPVPSSDTTAVLPLVESLLIVS